MNLKWAAVAASVVLAGAAQAAAIRVKITVDNSYALFYGTQTAATTFVGSDFNWTNTETYNFNLTSTQYLYVVTASDLPVAQGFLGQFENIDPGTSYKFYSNDPQWQIMATGLGSTGAPYTGSAADLALLSKEILISPQAQPRFPDPAHRDRENRYFGRLARNFSIETDRYEYSIEYTGKRI